jgi:hypothetical protein
MLIQMIVHQPQMLGPVLKSTPPWVWGLLAVLTWLGLSQARARTAGLARVTFMPIAMTALSVWGTMSAFGGSPQFGSVLLAWSAAATVALATLAPMAAPAGTRYDVGVELAMQPGLARDGQYAVMAGALYGLFSGIFTGRAVRLWRLASRPAAAGAAAFNA